MSNILFTSELFTSDLNDIEDNIDISVLLDKPKIEEEEGFDPQSEMSKLPNDIYLQSTVLPLLHNALTMVEKLRPDDPIGYIAHFMLTNKNYVNLIIIVI